MLLPRLEACVGHTTWWVEPRLRGQGLHHGTGSSFLAQEASWMQIRAGRALLVPSHTKQALCGLGGRLLR
jgi:hypothetical protein